VWSARQVPQTRKEQGPTGTRRKVDGVRIPCCVLETSAGPSKSHLVNPCAANTADSPPAALANACFDPSDKRWLFGGQAGNVRRSLPSPLGELRSEGDGYPPPSVSTEEAPDKALIELHRAERDSWVTRRGMPHAVVYLCLGLSDRQEGTAASAVDASEARGSWLWPGQCFSNDSGIVKLRKCRVIEQLFANSETAELGMGEDAYWCCLLVLPVVKKIVPPVRHGNTATSPPWT